MIGLLVLLAAAPELAYFHAGLRAGAAEEDADRAGVAAVAAHAIAEAMTSTGGRTLKVEVGLDTVTLAGACPPSELRRELARLRAAMAGPSDMDVERAKARVRAIERQLEKDPAAIAARAARRALHGGHPYGRAPIPRAGDLARVTAREVRAWLAARAPSARIATTPPEEEAGPAEGSAEERAMFPPEPPGGTRIVLVDRPRARTAHVHVERLAIRAQDADLAAALAAEAYLAERIGRSVPGASVRLRPRSQRGSLSIAFEVPTATAAAALARVLEALTPAAPAEEDALAAKRTAAAALVLRTRAPAAALDARVEAELLAYTPPAAEQVLAVARPEVERVLARLLSPDEGLRVAVVADATPALSAALLALAPLEIVSRAD